MNNKTITFVVLFIGFFTGGVIFLTYKKTPKQASNMQQVNQESDAAIVIKGLGLSHLILEEKFQLNIESDEAALKKGLSRLQCTNVICSIYGKKQNNLIVRAKNAFVDRTEKFLTISNNITGFYKNFSFTGSHLHYDFKKKVITALKLLQLNHPHIILRSNQTIIDLDNKQILMTHGVSTTFLK